MTDIMEYAYFALILLFILLILFWDRPKFYNPAIMDNFKTVRVLLSKNEKRAIEEIIISGAGGNLKFEYIDADDAIYLSREKS